ncbi:hypothetical protein J6590_073917 [Homalodisca vitripennis]|nr:hypothetical protein J6590_073917 [Homalodisca vitripennis]
MVVQNILGTQHRLLVNNKEQLTQRSVAGESYALGSLPGSALYFVTYRETGEKYLSCVIMYAENFIKLFVQPTLSYVLCFKMELAL